MHERLFKKNLVLRQKRILRMLARFYLIVAQLQLSSSEQWFQRLHMLRDERWKTNVPWASNSEVIRAVHA